ncbi:ABC transporter permease [Bacillus tianshenii]|uniref:ABC transporter permease n=1 Tax=Sutcliffiella tianshenii TaxID=1463404 RepID=UPI001CD4E97F|nr:ABC transporter permease [Bacillus tianshenii]MCA1319961.1 ABC transporter permease [Bacillus tianshenii]
MNSHKSFAGTWILMKFMMRRDRIQIPLWIFGLTLTIFATLVSFEEMYPGEEDRQGIAVTMANPASIALTGPKLYLEDYTIGAMMSHQMLGMAGIVVALMSVFLIVRHTRKEEETGRAELVRASVIGRHAIVTAAFIWAISVNLGLALIVALGLGAVGVESVTWEGSFLFGAGLASVGLSFSALALLFAQLMEHARAASGLGAGAIAVAFSMRAIGDLGDETLSWLSPIGWAQQTSAYVDNLWWPLILCLVFTTILVLIAFPLSATRDVGAGLIRPRRGRAEASAMLNGPLGLAFRLQRMNLLIWGFAMLLFGMSYGAFIGEAEEMFGSIGDSLDGMLPSRDGGVLADSFAAMFMTVAAMIGSIPALQSILKLKSEENAGRIDPLLSNVVSRTRLLGSYLIVALLSSLFLMLMAGVGMGITGSQSMEDSSYLGTLTIAGLSFTPALWVTIGLAVSIYGYFPRKASFSWAMVGFAFFVVYLGGVLQLPEWVLNLSPFTHVPRVPAEDFVWTPILGLTATALVFILAGWYGYRSRDISN